ncbi:MAG: cytochrome c family protein [Desulfobacterales bacterium]|nr:cytochrome c family protein [Desulfobacterales bacterium]
MKTIEDIITVLFIISVTTLANADTENIPEIIEFKGRLDTSEVLVDYPTRFQGPVHFTHNKHVQDYGAGCGDCHHDGSLDPIESYDPSESYSCDDCHYDTGLVRGPTAENTMAKDEQLMHRPNAIHALCLECHKENNKKKHLVVAPEACISCHTKQYKE